ncbi:MAG: hypothetical protein U0Z53_00420 [Blastocatellia bacterium]
MNRRCLKIIIRLLLCSLLFVSACEQRSRAVVADSAPDAVLKDLRNLEELRTRFNEDKGVPRLILLLSPT